MSGLDTALAEVVRGAFDAEERRALKAIFTALRDEFQGILLQKGVRKTATVNLTTIHGVPGFQMECAFKPASVLMLSASEGDGITYTQVPMAWEWDGASTVSLWDYTGILDGPLNGKPLVVDVFMEKSNG